MTAHALRHRPLPWGGLLLAAAVPFLWLHDTYQPKFSVGSGSKLVEIRLVDFAVLAVVVGAAATARRYGWRPLRPGVPLWIAGGTFCLLLIVACFYPRLREPHYNSIAYLVSALKFGEYALLAPATVLLLRRRADVKALVAGVILWSTAMTTVGLLQFAGVVNAFGYRLPARREPALAGVTEFSGLSAAALVVAAIALLFGTRAPRERAFAVLAGASGGVGVFLGGSVACLLGTVAALVLVAVVGRIRRVLAGGRLVAVAAIGAIAVVAVVAIRGTDITQFGRFLGIAKPNKQTTSNIQTYSQRTVLAYIGYRIWLDHPIFGAGYLSSTKDESVYGRYLPAAHRRFPTTDPAAFPSPKNQLGVQIFYLQALADLGVVGLALWFAVLAAGFLPAVRGALRGPPEASLVAGAWLLVVAGIWTSLGIVAGIPSDALTWLAAGLAVRATTPLEAPLERR